MFFAWIWRATNNRRRKRSGKKKKKSSSAIPGMTKNKDSSASLTAGAGNDEKNAQKLSSPNAASSSKFTIDDRPQTSKD